MSSHASNPAIRVISDTLGLKTNGITTLLTTDSTATDEIAGRVLEAVYGSRELISRVEAAERLGVSRVTVHVWEHRHDDFPRPFKVLPRAALYWWDEIEAWAQAHGKEDDPQLHLQEVGNAS